MQIILYAAPFSPASRHLVDTISRIGGDTRCGYYSTLTDLKKRLRQPQEMAEMMILCPSNGSELAALKRVRHLLRDKQIILVLPDGSARTLSNSHALRPRYVTYADGDLNDVAAVVEKMAGSEWRRTAIAVPGQSACDASARRCSTPKVPVMGSSR